MLFAVTDWHTVANRLHRFHDTVLTAGLPEATRLADTVDACWPEILGFLHTQITNTGTESTNRMVKDAAVSPSASTTWATSAAEYGSTAPGDHTSHPVPRRSSPLNFEEPVKSISHVGCG